MLFLKRFCLLLCVSVLFMSCKKVDKTMPPPVQIHPDIVKFDYVYNLMSDSFKSDDVIPQDEILDFVKMVNDVIASDSDDLLLLIDKKHIISAEYVPADLIPVKSCSSYVVNRNDLSLRKIAFDNLAVLGDAAKQDGIRLDISSTYRSYKYQERLYARNVAQMGQAAADRESAKPGSSQHQLGIAVDFGSVTDEYADTLGGKWLSNNAAKYGWSLSFPNGYEDVTGFRYECWHYRFIGVKACELQQKYFNNIQQFMIEFIDAWKNA